MQVTMQSGRVVVEPLPTFRSIPSGDGYTTLVALPPDGAQRLQVIYRAIKLNGYAFGHSATEYLNDAFNQIVRTDTDTESLIALGLGFNRDQIRERIEASFLALADKKS